MTHSGHGSFNPQSGPRGGGGGRHMELSSPAQDCTPHRQARPGRLYKRMNGLSELYIHKYIVCVYVAIPVAGYTIGSRV